MDRCVGWRWASRSGFTRWMRFSNRMDSYPGSAVRFYHSVRDVRSTLIINHQCSTVRKGSSGQFTHHSHNGKTGKQNIIKMVKHTHTHTHTHSTHMAIVGTSAGGKSFSFLIKNYYYIIHTFNFLLCFCLGEGGSGGFLLLRLHPLQLHGCAPRRTLAGYHTTSGVLDA